MHFELAIVTIIHLNLHACINTYIRVNRSDVYYCEAPKAWKEEIRREHNSNPQVHCQSYVTEAMTVGLIYILIIEAIMFMPAKSQFLLISYTLQV